MADQKYPEVLGVGELLWDMPPGGKQLGGAPGNFAYHVHAQGVSAAPVSAVGDDDLGHELLDRLRERGVDTSFIAVLSGDNHRPTGTVGIELDEHGKPTYDIHRNVAWDHIPITPDALEAARRSRAICFGSLAQREPGSRETIRRMLAEAPRDCITVFDVNLRKPFYDPEIIVESLRQAAVFKLSDEEVERLSDLLGMPGEDEAFCQACFERFGTRVVVVTRGPNGSMIRTPLEKHEHPGVKVDVKSTVGAGDSFTAAIVAGIINCRSIDKLHTRAAQLAAYVCTQDGAMPPIPDELRE